MTANDAVEGLAGTLQRGGSYFECDDNKRMKAIFALSDLADQERLVFKRYPTLGRGRLAF
jgi:hypothetical protein